MSRPKTARSSRASRPHKLLLYRHAVQHPPAEVAFIHRAYAHYRRGAEPTRLREDFAGTCAVAAEWVVQDDNRRALAVEAHGPTARWAQRRVIEPLGGRAEDLLLFNKDVLDVAGPKVDVVAALNFSILIYHDRAALLRYFRHARRSLRADGLFVVDIFGGPGAMRVGKQSRRITPPRDSGLRPYRYTWEQLAFDAVTNRIDCRIHFDYPGCAGYAGAMCYDWRLWTLPELTGLLREAGFDWAEVWLDRDRPEHGGRDGRYHPVRRMPAREDWVAYVLAGR